MILDDHDVSRLETSIDPAGSVGDNQSFHSNELHQPHRHGTLPKWVAFVGMEPALHAHDRFALQFAKDEFAAVAGNCANWKVRDVFVMELGAVHKEISEGTQTGPTYDSDDWSVLSLAQQEVGDTLNVFVRVAFNALFE